GRRDRARPGDPEGTVRADPGDGPAGRAAPPGRGLRAPGSHPPGARPGQGQRPGDPPHRHRRSRMRNIPVRTKLIAMLVLFVVGFAGFAAYAFSTLHLVKVNGPYYVNIIEHKDVIADVLPPPEYVIEAYLVCLQMVEETDPARLAKMVERCKFLKD